MVVQEMDSVMELFHPLNAAVIPFMLGMIVIP